jgi:hypothetical protein
MLCPQRLSEHFHGSCLITAQRAPQRVEQTLAEFFAVKVGACDRQQSSEAGGAQPGKRFVSFVRA